RPLCQLVDRSECLPEQLGALSAVLVESLLSRARVQDAREERLRDGIVELARDAAALLHGALVLTPFRFGQLLDRALPLTDDGAQEQRGQRRDEDVELRAERSIVDRLLVERADPVGRDADGDRSGDGRAQGHPGWAEAK